MHSSLPFTIGKCLCRQLPGSMATERATGLTSHLDAMGCRKSARAMCVRATLTKDLCSELTESSSWHLSVSSAYVIAWIVVAVIWQRSIFSGTNVGLFIVLYVVTGLSLASWTHLVSVPFASAPTLAAITCASHSVSSCTYVRRGLTCG